MAATAVMKLKGGSPDNLAYEVFTASIGGAETECDITPTYLKSITHVSITPRDAASAATLIGYVKTFVMGAPTVTVVGDNNTEYLVMLEGRIA